VNNSTIGGFLWVIILAFVVYRFYRKRHRRHVGSSESVAETPNPNSIRSRLVDAFGNLIGAALVAFVASVPLAFVGGALSGLLPRYEAEIRSGVIGLVVLVFLAGLSVPVALFVLGLMACGLPGFLLLGSIYWDGPLTPLVLVKLGGLRALLLLGTLWSYWCWSAWREERKWKSQYRAIPVEDESRT
jgi:hypothetical protein